MPFPLIVARILTMLGGVAALFGITWILTFYLSGGVAPIAALGSWNVLLGLVAVLIGGVELVVSAILWHFGRQESNSLQ